jgi:hypothetical protein
MPTGRGDAERHFKTALQISEQIGARPWMAHTQRQHARMLLGRDDAGDRDRAIGLLADANRTYLNLGMNSWARRTLLADVRRHVRSGLDSLS